uniref:Uncharacterized protein n=1 Tax=Rhizophora mucronata TaxID=61149 RepID=A0A2P2R382_RHIMU
MIFMLYFVKKLKASLVFMMERYLCTPTMEQSPMVRFCMRL